MKWELTKYLQYYRFQLNFSMHPKYNKCFVFFVIHFSQITFIFILTIINIQNIDSCYIVFDVYILTFKLDVYHILCSQFPKNITVRVFSIHLKKCVFFKYCIYLLSQSYLIYSYLFIQISLIFIKCWNKKIKQ